MRLRSEEFLDLYSPLNIIRVINPRTIGEACGTMGEIREVHKGVDWEI
jgi:hypothetical protein